MPPPSLSSLLSLEMSPFSDMPTWAHLSSVNSKEWMSTRNPQALQTKPEKEHSLEHYIITCLYLTKEQLLACIKIHSACHHRFPRDLQIPGSMHKGDWSLEWAILINLWNSTRTCRCIYSNGEEKKNLSWTASGNRVFCNLAPSLIETSTWMTCIYFICCPYQGTDIIWFVISMYETKALWETGKDFVAKSRLLLLNNYCAT